jgi:type VI secretion system protein ImpK
LLTSIARLISWQKIPDGEAFRRKTKIALQQVERDAIGAGYDANDIRETHFAVVAFLDEIILNSNDPVRAEWERRTLQEELAGKTVAGVAFFEKLDRFAERRDSSQLADILEVFALCLLLGFQGRYSGGLRGELEIVTERTRKRIERIRGASSQISPNVDLPRAAEPGVLAKRQKPDRALLIAAAAGVLAVLIFLILKLNLIWMVGEVRGRLI